MTTDTNIGITPVGDWKKEKGSTPLALPSGKTCLVRNPGMEAFLKAGIVPNSLVPIVDKALKEKRPPSTKAIQEKVESTEGVADMLRLVDDVVVFCVVKPKVYPAPKSEADRDDDILYVDEVSEIDKAFIFNWSVGGTSDLEQFRRELAEDVAAVSGRPDVEVPS